MLRSGLLLSIFTLGLLTVINKTYRCACDSLIGEFSNCNWGYHCHQINKTCVFSPPSEGCYYYYETEKHCGEFQNCQNSTDGSFQCPILFGYCEDLSYTRDKNCVPYRSYLCSNYTTSDSCQADSQCLWNDKNKCIAERSIQTCVDYNFYDMTSRCGVSGISSHCILENGKCRDRHCSEWNEEASCVTYQEIINRTHVKLCYWKDGQCKEAPDLSVYTTAEQCSHIKSAVFIDQKCQMCSKFIQDSDLVQSYCYKDYYYMRPCQMDDSSLTSDYQQNSTDNDTSSSTQTTNSTSSNQTTTTGGQTSTNTTTQQNSSTSANEITPGSTYSELISILILATGLIV